MYYSDEILEEIRSRTDIVDLIGSYVSLKERRSGDYWACCPFHHEKSPSFHVQRGNQMYYCFGCHAAGTVFTFMQEYENMSFTEAVRALAERCGYALPEREMSEQEKHDMGRKARLKEANRMAAAYFHYLLTKTEHGKKGLTYLHDRGYSDETIKAYGMGYADVRPDDLRKYLKSKGFTDQEMYDAGLIEFDEKHGAYDKFWNRVMVPITDINNKVIAFGGRVLGDGKPKYLNTKSTDVFDKSRNLFAMSIAKRSKKRGIILCEGYMDVITLHQAGFDNATASLGTAVTPGHAALIKRYTDEVYLSYDSDEAGTKAALRAIDICRDAGLVTRVINMKPYKDPDEFINNLGAQEYEKRLEDAELGVIFAVHNAAEGVRMKDPEEKLRFSKNAARIICTVEESIARQGYIDAVAEEYSIDKDELKRMVREYGTSMQEKSLADEEKNRERQQKQSAVAEDNKSQRLLLTWMANDVELFRKLSDIIDEEDFPDADYKAIAHALFEQYKTTGMVNLAMIVDTFPDAEKQRLAASILQTELSVSVDGEERERALNEVVKRVKSESIERALAADVSNDLNLLTKLIRQKADLDKLNIKL